MSTRIWIEHFSFSAHSDGAVFGAFINAARKLEWTITDYESEGIFTLETGIIGAANNEKIIFKKTAHDFFLSSETIGERIFSERENRENVQILHSYLAAELKARTAEKLEKVFKDFQRDWDRKFAINYTLRDKLLEIWDIILLRHPWPVAYWIVVLNVLVYSAMAISGAGIWELNTQDLINWGGNYTPLTLGGEYWRLLTSFFLHQGIMHLFSNMIGLLIGGLVAEELLGKRRFLTAYLICGIGASAFSIYMHDAVMSVGASGAIFGCFGLVLGMASTKILTKSERKLLFSLFAIFVVLNLAQGFKSYIDNWAHIGGLVLGWCGGFLWAIVLQRKENRKIRLAMDFGVPMVALALFAALIYLKSDFFPKYFNLLRRFDKNVETAVYFYTKRNENNGRALLMDSGMFYLQKGDENLSEALHLKDIPSSERERLLLVFKLNAYRKDVFYYTGKSMENEQDSTYRDSLNAAGLEFEKYLKLLDQK